MPHNVTFRRIFTLQALSRVSFIKEKRLNGLTIGQDGEKKSQDVGVIIRGMRHTCLFFVCVMSPVDKAYGEATHSTL